MIGDSIIGVVDSMIPEKCSSIECWIPRPTTKPIWILPSLLFQFSPQFCQNNWRCFAHSHEQLISLSTTMKCHIFHLFTSTFDLCAENHVLLGHFDIFDTLSTSLKFNQHWMCKFTSGCIHFKHQILIATTTKKTNFIINMIICHTLNIRENTTEGNTNGDNPSNHLFYVSIILNINNTKCTLFQ